MSTGSLRAPTLERRGLSNLRRRLPVVLGGGCLVAIALVTVSVWQAAERARSPIEPPGAWGALYWLAVASAFALYVVGAWLIRSRGAPVRVVVVLAIAIQLVPLAAPLLYSTDSYTYWSYGRIQAVHDGNPYVNPPSEWPDDPAYALMGAQWHDTTSAYGPLWTVTSAGVAKAAGDSPDAAAWLFKAIAALSSVALVLAAVALAPPGRKAFAAAFVGWNPVLALQFAGGGHNDTLMMALPLAGMAVAARGRPNLGAAFWPVAIVVKWLPLIFLPLLVARDRKAFGWKGLAISGVAVALVSTLLYGVHWVHAAAPISSQLRRASSTSIPFYVEKWFGLPQYRVTEVLAVLFALAYLWLLRQAWRGNARLGLTAGLFCLSLSWLPSWYVAWPVSLTAVEEDRTARWVSLGLTAWLLRDAVAMPW